MWDGCGCRDLLSVALLYLFYPEPFCLASMTSTLLQRSVKTINARAVGVAEEDLLFGDSPAAENVSNLGCLVL